jgi:hypothetical protein
MALNSQVIAGTLVFRAHGTGNHPRRFAGKDHRERGGTTVGFYLE